MNLKKTLILLVTACLVFSLCACSSKVTPAPADDAVPPSPTASAVPEASPDAENGAVSGSGTAAPAVSKQEGAEKTVQPDPVLITAAEAENIALNDAMTDRGAPQNVKSYEAREGDRVIGWNVEFDLAGQHMTYLIDLVTGDILDVQFE